MIVLDTNIISELMRRSPDPRVVAWVAGQPTAGLFDDADPGGGFLRSGPASGGTPSG